MPKFSQSRLAAKLQRMVSYRREDAGLYREIAEKLPLLNAQRILDIGTGTGLQLKVIHELAPNAKLFGLDLSESAIKEAYQALNGLDVDLREGDKKETTYQSDFFDITTCNTSMSYWKEPVECFDEIYRILKPGGQALLFEPQKDFALDEVLDTIRENMSEKS